MKNLEWLLLLLEMIALHVIYLTLEDEFYTCPQTRDVYMLQKKLFPRLVSTPISRKEGTPLIRAQDHALSCEGFMSLFLRQTSLGEGVVV